MTSISGMNRSAVFRGRQNGQFNHGTSVIAAVITLREWKQMPRYGWLRCHYSLRTLLLITSVIAAYLAYAAFQDSERRKLISEIESVGGYVEFDESLTFRLFHSERVTHVSVPHSSVGQINGARLKKFDNLSTLGIIDFEFENDGMRISGGELRIAKMADGFLDNFGNKPSAN